MTSDQNAIEPAGSGSILSDFGGMFNFLMDPAGAARYLNRGLFWLAPLIVVSIVYMVCGLENFPLVQQAMSNQPMPANANPDQFQKGIQIGLTIQRVAIYAAPIFFLAISAVCALIVLGTASVMGFKVTFLQMFNLMAGLSVIGALQIIAMSVILHFRGEPSSMADLQPALGLDIFAPATMNKAAVAVLGFFNIFEIWQIVMAAAIFAAYKRTSIGKAVAAIAPVYLIALLFKVVGALLSSGR